MWLECISLTIKLFEKIDQIDQIQRLLVKHCALKCGNISQKSQKVQVVPLPLDVSVILHSLVNRWPTSDIDVVFHVWR